MSSRWYPIFRKGNPQLRVFLPDFWLKLVHPFDGQPKNVVQFIAPTQMSSIDIKNYLEKIYKVQVADVRSEIEEGELKRQRAKNYIIKGDDFRRAFVTLKDGETFEFPDITTDREKKDDTEFQKVSDQMAQTFKKFDDKNKSRPGIPAWFGI